MLTERLSISYIWYQRTKYSTLNQNLHWSLNLIGFSSIYCDLGMFLRHLRLAVDKETFNCNSEGGLASENSLQGQPLSWHQRHRQKGGKIIFNFLIYMWCSKDLHGKCLKKRTFIQNINILSLVANGNISRAILICYINKYIVNIIIDMFYLIFC